MRKLLLATLIGLLPLASYGDEDSWLTRSGYYRVSFQSELQPIVINRIHTWIFHVETPDGAAVDDAEISVTGGMPLHNHGLPTAPQMTADLGNGSYRVEGMRFHMAGDWELLVTIDAAGRRDTVVIPLTL